MPDVPVMEPSETRVANLRNLLDAPSIGEAETRRASQDPSLEYNEAMRVGSGGNNQADEEAPLHGGGNGYQVSLS